MHNLIRDISKRFPDSIVFPINDVVIFGTNGKLVMCPTFEIKDGLVRGEEAEWPIHDPEFTPEQNLEANLKAMQNYSDMLYKSVEFHNMEPIIQLIGIDKKDSVWTVSMYIRCKER